MASEPKGRRAGRTQRGAAAAARISDAEWEVMRLLWDRGESTAADLTAALAEKRAASGLDEWSPTTVKTLIARLVEKNAVGFVVSGKAYVYRPLLSRAECVDCEAGSFLERIFGGALTPMLAHFVKGRQIDARELAELRRVLDEADGRARRDRKGGAR